MGKSSHVRQKSWNQRRTHPAVYHLKYPQFMEEVKRAGLKMHVWTANKPEHIQLVKDAGAEAVITNYPDRALEIVNS